MCRSIKTLRKPYVSGGKNDSEVDESDVRAAALQYVRKISGFRSPSVRNTEAFNNAVETIAEATRTLLDQLAPPSRSPRT